MHTWNKYSNLEVPPASTSEVETIRPAAQTDENGAPLCVMGVPVTKPLAAPNNQLNQNSKETASRTVASCAGGCGSAACAAASCGAAGCAGSCGGNSNNMDTIS